MSFDIWTRKSLTCAPSTLETQDATLKRDGNRMRPVGGSKLGKNMLDVNSDGAVRGAEFIRDFFVSEPPGNQRQHFHFARSQCRLRHVLRESFADFGRHEPLSGMHGSNCAHDLGVD